VLLSGVANHKGRQTLLLVFAQRHGHRSIFSLISPRRREQGHWHTLLALKRGNTSVWQY
jgi:hypothetical protein